MEEGRGKKDMKEEGRGKKEEVYDGRCKKEELYDVRGKKEEGRVLRGKIEEGRRKKCSLPPPWSYVFFDSLSSFKDLHLFTKIFTSSSQSVYMD